jgi:prolipoprotein diacylglyceryltransferase
VANWPIYALSLLFGVWLYFRILKGAHVIFDTSLRRVYFFGIFGALLAGGIVMAYFQMHYNTLDFIGQVIREHKAGM